MPTMCFWLCVGYVVTGASVGMPLFSNQPSNCVGVCVGFYLCAYVVLSFA